MADLPRLGSAAAALLAEERALASESVARHAAVDAMKSRVRERVAASLVAGAGAGAGVLGGGTNDGASSAWSLARIARLVVGGALLAAGGFALGRYTSPTATTRIATPAVPTVTASGSPAIAPALVEPPAIGSTAPSAPSAASNTRSAPLGSATAQSVASDRALAKEGALVDRARRALHAGRPRDALEAIREHRVLTHGAGQLAEERDVLEIHALVRDGQTDVARAAAARFRLRHPSSAFAAAIDDAVGADDTR